MTLLDEFYNARSVSMQHEAVRRLFASKQIHSAVSEPRFEEQIEELGRTAEESKESEERLLAIATLGRLMTVSKAMRTRIEPLQRRAVASPLPPLRLLPEPDDRGYVVEACRLAEREWLIPFLAAATVEEVGEKNKAREKMVDVLLEKVGSVAGVIGQLGIAFRTWRPQTDAPADSTARRFRLVITALHAIVSSKPCNVGIEVGKQLARATHSALKFNSEQASPKIGIEVADAVLTLIHELIRHRFVIAMDESLYESLAGLRSNVGVMEWNRYVMISKPMALIVEDISQAIALLAVQGRSDEQLFRRLVDATGSEHSARAITKQILATELGIPDHVQAWLSGESASPPPPSELALVAQLQTEFNERQTVAILFREGARLATLAERTRSGILPDVSLLAPSHGGGLESLISQGLAVADLVRGFGYRRQLRLVGEPGEIVDFSAIYHALDHAGVRQVRIIQPAVEELRDGGLRNVVLKAVVEPADS
jgi:hypothetical protein